MLCHYHVCRLQARRDAHPDRVTMRYVQGMPHEHLLQRSNEVKAREDERLRQERPSPVSFIR